MQFDRNAMLKTTLLKKPSRFLWIALVLQWFACNPSANDSHTFRVIPVQYPKAPRDLTIADTLYGKRVPDSFRALENGSLPTTRDWMIQQQTLTEKYLSQIPSRANIQKQLTELWNSTRYAAPIHIGNFYYVLQQERLQPQPVLYRMQSMQDTSRQPILNFNSQSISGARILKDFAFSADGSLLAYQVAENGARWSSIFIKDLESNRTLLDTLNWVQFSNIAWYRDGFFYSRYPRETQFDGNAPYQFQQVYYHRVGTGQADDELIFAERSNPFVNVRAQTTTDERFLIINAQQQVGGNALYVRDLQSETLDLTPVIEDFDYVFKVVNNVGNNLLVYTNYKAPNYRLVQINLQRPEEKFWENLIPESKEVLQSVHLYGGKLVAAYAQNGSNGLKIFDLRGKLQREFAIPDHGQITDWSGDPNQSQAFFTFQPFTTASNVYLLNTNDFSIQNLIKNENIITNSSNYDIHLIDFKSYDGTEIPMTVLSQKGINLDGKRPALLTTDELPFTMTRVLLENGGIVAVVHVRGSEDWGEAWRQEGLKAKKQNAFDDFQAAAEYLIANKNTNPAKLAVYGKGDGGLIVGASLTQRPDLFRVALIDSGILDLIHYQSFTIGWTWESRYGTAGKPKEFDALVAYSPLQNIVPAKYPATMILTSNRNNQVVPGHSYKFAAELQQQQQADLPVLLRITQGGEQLLAPQQLDQTTDMLTFLFYNLQEPIK